MVEPQGIGENELAEMLDMSEEEVMTFLSDGHDFTVSEICSILMALDLDMRFEIVPF